MPSEAMNREQCIHSYCVTFIFLCSFFPLLLNLFSWIIKSSGSSTIVDYTWCIVSSLHSLQYLKKPVNIITLMAFIIFNIMIMIVIMIMTMTMTMIMIMMIIIIILINSSSSEMCIVKLQSTCLMSSITSCVQSMTQTTNTYATFLWHFKQVIANYILLPLAESLL